MGPHIVFTWELGSGYGHIAGFLPLARELSRLGCTVSCILRDLSNVGRFELPRGNRVFQAPIWLSRKGDYPPVGNYSEPAVPPGFISNPRRCSA
ncbi:MAG: hypothetical protein U5S82_03050 [Gammaproteobacteria bacterium]|nr:hypothetical protein [Gammaproteobacteria bacterium]